jgi:hypothetical protein
MSERLREVTVPLMYKATVTGDVKLVYCYDKPVGWSSGVPFTSIAFIYHHHLGIQRPQKLTVQ